jgi:hypothetical protein
LRVLESMKESQEEAGEDAEAGEGDADEDIYETVDEASLAPLPEENDMKYPQENPNYFRNKKYVRKDKYELSWLLPNNVVVPELMEVFDQIV